LGVEYLLLDERGLHYIVYYEVSTGFPQPGLRWGEQAGVREEGIWAGLFPNYYHM